jgi:hypothetical protein
MKAVMASFKAQLDRKSVSTVAWLEGGMPKIILGWVACIVVAGILRTSFVASPITNGASLFQTILPYILLGLSCALEKVFHSCPLFAGQNNAIPCPILVNNPMVNVNNFGCVMDKSLMCRLSKPNWIIRNWSCDSHGTERSNKCSFLLSQRKNCEQLLLQWRR